MDSDSDSAGFDFELIVLPIIVFVAEVSTVLADWVFIVRFVFVWVEDSADSSSAIPSQASAFEQLASFSHFQF